MATFKIEIELVLAEGSTPKFVFDSISDQLEEGESMPVARFQEVIEEE